MTINVGLKKGEQIPQTVEALQEIMARDAELMLEQAKTIANQSQIINQLRQKVASQKRRAKT